MSFFETKPLNLIPQVYFLCYFRSQKWSIWFLWHQQIIPHVEWVLISSYWAAVRWIWRCKMSGSVPAYPSCALLRLLESCKFVISSILGQKESKPCAPAFSSTQDSVFWALREAKGLKFWTEVGSDIWMADDTPLGLSINHPSIIQGLSDQVTLLLGFMSGLMNTPGSCSSLSLPPQPLRKSKLVWISTVLWEIKASSQSISADICFNRHLAQSFNK